MPTKNTEIWSILIALGLFVSTPCLAGSQEDYTAALRQLVEATFDSGEPGGTVLVARGGKVMYQTSRGVATLGGRQLFITDRFRIASVTKQFTAVAILQLIEDGRLQLEDRLVVLVPEYPEHARDVTVEMLLNHTSGIRDFTRMDSFSLTREQNHVTTIELVDFFKDEPLEFAPGSGRAYSNAGYALLGIIIERVTGMTYAEYLHAAIFQPTGMANTTAEIGGAVEKDPVQGHAFIDGEVVPAVRTSLTWPFAAGCIRSTVEDLHKWDLALWAGELVSLEMLNQAHQPTILPDGTTVHYGYGWDLSRVQDDPSIEHGGLISGFSSCVVSVPEKDVFVTVLVNQAWGGVFDFTVKLAAIAIGEPYEEPTVIEIPTEALAQYEGLYTDTSGNQRRIENRDGRLHSQRVGGLGIWLVPISTDRFTMENQLTEISFQRDQHGDVINLQLHSRAEDTRWYRVKP